MYHDLERKTITPCANGIMVFRMDKEEFSAMPHSGSSIVCNSKKAHETMTLSMKNNQLSFSNLFFPKYTVDIWILEDYESHTWIKRYKVDLLNEKIFPLSLHLTEILGIDRDLFLYNLDYRIVKKIELPRTKMTLYTCNPYMKSFLAIA
ncbi:hypothetical protein P3S68_019953 [Capsicum galapagoense]